MRQFATVLLMLSVVAGYSQSYKKLHEEAIVIDTHNDVLSSATMKGLDLGRNLKGKTHSDLARFKKGSIDIQVFSIFCDGTLGKDTAFKFANIEIDSLYALAGRYPGKMMMVTSPAQLQEAVKEHRLGCMIGVEGGHMIEDRLDYLDSLYKRGARYLTLTWNNSTSWASSAKDESNKEAGANGLNDFGRSVVQRMNELGMMVDLSHTGEKTFWNVIHTTRKPVLLSHSSVYRLCPVFRNLKDDQIKAVAKNGGVIQVNFYPGFIDSNYQKNRRAVFERHKLEKDSLQKLGMPDYEIAEMLAKKYRKEMDAIRPPLSLLIDHIDYIVKLVGIDYVGLGADMDGIESLPQELRGVEDFPKITKALLQRGYSETDIRKILGENFIRLFEANSSRSDR